MSAPSNASVASTKNEQQTSVPKDTSIDVAKEMKDEQPAVEQPKPVAEAPPNGGILAWSQVLVAFFLFFNPWGLILGFGAYQEYYDANINRSPSDVSWVGTFQGFLLFLVGILTGPIYDMGYFRELIMVGTFLTVFGMMMTSLATEYYQIFLAQGVVVGLGAGCLFLPSVAVASQYFTTKRALAVGITASGGSIGGVIYPIAFRKLQPVVGFGWATRVLGFIALGTLLISLALIKPRVKQAAKARALLDLSAFTSPGFLLLTVSIFVYFIGLYFPFFYISIWAEEKLGTPSDTAFYLFAILNAGSAFGRIIPGLIADRIGSLNTIIPCLLLTGVLGFAWMGVKSFGGLVVYAIFYGFFSGACVSLPVNILVGVAPELSKIGTWMGMCFTFAGIGLLIGNPIAGAILDKTGGSFVGAQSFSAACVLIGAGFMIALRLLKMKQNKGWKV